MIYNVSLLYFGPEQHMAVGVACQEMGYHDTGYAYIETTRVSLSESGLDPLKGTLHVISSYPLVIPIGNGISTYRRCNETLAINDGLSDISAHLEILITDLRDWVLLLHRRSGHRNHGPPKLK